MPPRHPSPLRRLLGTALSGAVVLVLAASGSVAAHVERQFGPYAVELGWLHEPTYTGERNAVVVIIHDLGDKPVTDVAAGDLTVTVTAGGQTSAALPLVPDYDAAEATGTPGSYTADLIPTQPGEYTFHLVGTIHGTPVDETATSSDTTFNAVEDPGAIQFPVKVPTTGDLATKVDRLGGRAQAAAEAAASAATAARSVSDAANAATSAAESARDTASAASRQAALALVVGVVVGGIGVAIGLAGVVLAVRARRAAERA